MIRRFPSYALRGFSPFRARAREIRAMWAAEEGGTAEPEARAAAGGEPRAMEAGAER